MNATGGRSPAPLPARALLPAAAPAQCGAPDPLDRLARAAVLALLRRAGGGEIVLDEQAGAVTVGAVDPTDPLRATVRVRSPAFYRHLLRGSVGLGDSYMQGLWDCDDLVSLIRIAARNAAALDRARRLIAPLLAPVQRASALLAANTRRRARRRVEAHYDLGNELFELFLDPTMMYSCALFERPHDTLEQASLAKLARVCEKLALGPADHVLEIGTGWGGFALYAAAHHGCRVTTATLSPEQRGYALERVRDAGLQDRVEVVLCDYRDLRGRYDKLVSIEMIEAIGWRQLPTFFRRCSRLLQDDGAMLLQAIVIDDRAYEVEKAGRSFINTYIFPGGCLPSQEAIAHTLARAGDLRQIQLEDITSHYATTLARWRERFLAARDRVGELGYDERFRRMWELYLSYCEGGFRERRIRDVQLLLGKPGYRGERQRPALAPAA